MRLVALAMLAGGLAGTSAAVGDDVRARYELTWNGLTIGTFETDLATGEGGYRLAYEARTAGFLEWLFPFVSRGQSVGDEADATPVPSRFVGQSSWGDGGSRWDVQFGADGEALRVDIPAEDLAERDPVPAALQRAPDPLALALGTLATVAPGERVGGSSFDGKRALRFEAACDAAFAPLVGEGGGAAYAATGGRELRCEVDGELLAGGSKRWRRGDERRTEREPARVWLAEGIVESRLWPVRVEVDTRYGQVTVRLVRLDSPERP